MKVLRLFCALLLIATFGGCRRNEVAHRAGNLPTRNSISWWEMSDITRLNPLLSPDAHASYVYSLIWESLNTTNPRTGEAMPWLASLPIVSADKKRYDFTLAPNARWADGTVVTAEDVVFSIKAAMNPLLVNAQPIRAALNLVDSASAYGTTTISVFMREPYAFTESFVFQGYLSILPKHVFDPKKLTDHITWSELKRDAPKNPSVKEWATFFEDPEHDRDSTYLIGSGPYRLQRWVTNEKLVLTRRKDAWSLAKPWGEAYADEIVFRTINNPDAAVQSLKSKELDIMAFMPGPLFRSIDTAKQSYIRKDTAYVNQYTFIAWNNLDPLFADVRVRSALSHLIDKPSMIHSLLYDQTRPIDGPVMFTQRAYKPASNPIVFDVSRAKALLAEAGWTDSDNDGTLDKMVSGKKRAFSFTFLTISGNELARQLLLVVVEQLKKVGIQAEISSVEASVYLESIREHRFQAALASMNGNAVEDDLYTVWHSSQSKNKGSNWFSFRNAHADSVLDAARREFDPAKRDKLYQDFQETVRAEQPVSFLWSVPVRIARLDRFDNVEFFHQSPCISMPLWIVRGAGVEPNWSSPSTIMRKR